MCMKARPDGRQAGDITPSRFRPRYRALTDAEKALHDQIKAKAVEALFTQAYEMACPMPEIEADALDDLVHRESSSLVAGIFDYDPKPEYFSDGMKALELSVMWTVKGLTA